MAFLPPSTFSSFSSPPPRLLVCFFFVVRCVEGNDVESVRENEERMRFMCRHNLLFSSSFTCMSGMGKGL